MTTADGARHSAPRTVNRPGESVAPRPAGESAFAEVRFLTVAEVATVMRVSKMTVYRMVHGGDLPAVRVGRSFRVPEKAVHDYLRSAFIEAGWAPADGRCARLGNEAPPAAQAQPRRGVPQSAEERPEAPSSLVAHASRAPPPGPYRRVRPGHRGAQSDANEVFSMGSVIKKRRKRMAKKKHRKLLKKTRVQRRNKK
jgi:excisionase family DNA binding protein